MAELIAYTLLGDVEKEEGLGLNTMVIALDTQRFQTPTMIQTQLHTPHMTMIY